MRVVGRYTLSQALGRAEVHRVNYFPLHVTAASPVNLAVGSGDRQIFLAGADRKVGDGAHIPLDVKRLRRGKI